MILIIIIIIIIISIKKENDFNNKFNDDNNNTDDDDDESNIPAVKRPDVERTSRKSRTRINIVLHQLSLYSVQTKQKIVCFTIVLASALCSLNEWIFNITITV